MITYNHELPDLQRHSLLPGYETRNAYRIVVGEVLENVHPLGRPRRWEDNIKMDILERGGEVNRTSSGSYQCRDLISKIYAWSVSRSDAKQLK